ncbi:MAG: preprotein translocase subunit SecA [bacterium]|nr:preprotein translocase subunit SecA [bacterium]
MNRLLKAIFGDQNKKILDGLSGQAEEIGKLEGTIETLSDSDLRAKTHEFKARIEKGETTDSLMSEAFAVVREAAKRTLSQRHYDVQLMGGIVLHQAGIAEMRTGEGKTLTSTLPIYLNALTGKGVHVVTVNDYLAKRDAVWMGQIFGFLGLTLGVIQHEGGYLYDESFKADSEDDQARDNIGSFRIQMDFLRPAERKEAYAADITYGTNNQFGFDYLRDNMATRIEARVQRELHYALIDEIDSILIDEARTPLIISAPAEESADLYTRFASLITDLKLEVHYNVDEKMRAATFTDAGIALLEKRLGVENLYTDKGLEYVHHAEQALRAHAVYEKDREYVVQDGEVKIVDEFTGRIMEGRRFGDGLHQAIEAKEGVEIRRESRTLATITFQNYFRIYEKLSGMTGTAATEAEEFSKIYELDVVEIPTNQPIARIDASDKMYQSLEGKLSAIIKDVKEKQELGQPVLIGTVSIEDNDVVSAALKKAGVKHEVLNAKNHEREAEIVAQAGRKAAVTVATNMAGRGVDIVLGGQPKEKEREEEVKALGGLHVIGTERHESRRIDNQLRGRSGRQGDPGSTQFYVSMDDKLMRIFGSDRAKGMLSALNMPADVPIESKIITNSLEKAQMRVEGRNFDSRKHVLEYDDVLNKHREGIYTKRNGVLEGTINPTSEILRMTEEEIERVVLFHTGQQVDVPSVFRGGDAPDYDPKEILEVLGTIMTLPEEVKSKIRTSLGEFSKDQEELARQRTEVIEAFMAEARKRAEAAKETFNNDERLQNMMCTLILRAIDNTWVRHLDSMRYLRRSIGLRGYGQRDPLIEYKKEAFQLYEGLQQSIAREVVYNSFKILDQVMAAREVIQLAPSIIETSKVVLQGAKKSEAGKGTTFRRALQRTIAQGAANTTESEKVGRNDSCPCGATKSDGTPKKYKHCHGKS